MEPKKRTSYKGKKRNFDRRKSFEEEKSNEYRSKPNDPKWYVGSNQLASDVANLSFNNPLGVPVTTDAYQEDSFIFPGILAIYTAPAVGVSNNGLEQVSPVNVAMRRIFADVRSTNAGSANYDPADLMQYLLAMDSIYSYAAYLIRVYGVLRLINPTNRYVPLGFLKAMGVRYDGSASIISNIANLRAYINMYITKASAFAVPNIMPFYQRHFWMYTGMYKDEDVAKSQFYMYVPAYLYKYQVNSETAKGELIPRVVAMSWNDSQGFIHLTQGRNLTELMTIGDDLLNAMLYNQDIAIMSGDIIKRYGDNLFKMNLIPDDFPILPTFSEEVLMQIHNTSFIGTKPLDMNGNVSQSTLVVSQDPSIGKGDINFSPRFSDHTQLYHRVLLDFWKENPTPEDVLVATRNKIVTSRPGSDGIVFIDCCGSDIALCGEIVRYNPIEGTFGLENAYGSVSNYETPSIIGNVNVQTGLGIFNERPVRYAVSPDHDHIIGVDGEISNYTSLNNADMRKIHESALLAMFGVPKISGV